MRRSYDVAAELFGRAFEKLIAACARGFLLAHAIKLRTAADISAAGQAFDAVLRAPIGNKAAVGGRLRAS